MLTDLEELCWVGCAGQGVIKVVGGVVLAPLGRVREGLVGILDLLEMLLDLLLLAFISHCCACFVWVVLKRSLPVGCGTDAYSAEFLVQNEAGNAWQSDPACHNPGQGQR